MKKFRNLGLAVILLAFGLMAIGSSSTSTSETKAIVGADGGSSDTTEAESEIATETEAAAKITIEEQVLFEQDGLKVTATEYVSDSIWGDSIKLLIENDGSSDIGLGCTALIVNDYMITDLFSSTIAAGKKANEELDLSSSSLKAAGIETVGKVEVYFHTFDPDSYMTIDNLDCVTIETSAFDSMDSTPNDAGQELYNSDGIRIVGKYVDENSFWGTAILLYIENNCGENKIIQCEDLSINGYMLTPYFSCTIYDGKKAVDDITLLSSQLEENGITEINDVELKFKIIDEDFMGRVETDVIAFSAQ